MIKWIAIGAAALVIVVAGAGCGGSEKSPYQQGYDQAVALSREAVASYDRCADMALGWFVLNQREKAPSHADQREFERGCRAGNGES